MDSFEVSLQRYAKPIHSAAISVIKRFNLKGLNEQAVTVEAYTQFWVCYMKGGVTENATDGRVFLRVRRGIMKSFRMWLSWCKSTRNGKTRTITPAYKLGDDLTRRKANKQPECILPFDTSTLLTELYGWRGDALTAYANGESSNDIIKRYSLHSRLGISNLLRTIRRQTDAEKEYRLLQSL